MVTQVDRRGLRDWLAQRVSAILIAIYAIFIFAYLIVNKPVSYTEWHNLFHYLIMKIATVLVVLAVLWHAWIGLWTVFTDYVKITVIRLILEGLVILLLLAGLVWAVEILWG